MELGFLPSVAMSAFAGGLELTRIKRMANGWLLPAAFLVAGCVAPYDFARWTVPVPESVPVHGYHPISDGERDAEPPIELVEELVIGEEGGDLSRLFGSIPPRVAVAADGRIAVLDPSNQRVQLHDAQGSWMTAVGRAGQGPGELRQPVALLVDADMVLVYDVVNRRTTRWSWDGDLLGSRTTDPWGNPLIQTDAGDLVWRTTERHPEGQDTIFRRVLLDASVAVEYARAPWPERVIDPPLGEIAGTEPDAWWVGTVPPSFTATAAGDVYVSPFEEYQVFAFEPGGNMAWALQVGVERPPISRREIDHFMAMHARRFPDRTAAQVAWPERQYALADIKVDGHGHLYVFPYVPKGTPAAVPRPVDVYSATGERLYGGTMAGRIFDTAFASYNGPMLDVGWQGVRGDHVWGVAESPRAGDHQIVRFRLVEPF